MIDAAQALHRFGLGPRPGDLDRIGDGVRNVLEQELERNPVLTDPALKSSSEALTIMHEQKERVRDFKRAARNDRAHMMTDAPPPADGGMMDGGKKAEGKMAPDELRKIRGGRAIGPMLFRDEVGARLARAKEAEAGFAERLVAFWTNHFTVSAKTQGVVRVLAGSFEREAIRANVFNRFDDMLLAATRHPAMLRYLDNAKSIGPNSFAGKRRSRGLNENHAREIMELHTLGVDGGYTQADVIAFAKVLTGWTFDRGGGGPDEAGEFAFNPRWHEPGPQTILGKVYAQDDVTQGEAVLRDLARHPATARHIARKFARSFVSDAPPDALVARLEANFRQSGGDLKALARTLLQSEEAWSTPPNKIKTPQEFLFSAVRGLDIDVPANYVIRAMRDLGQEPWNAGSPAGYPDDNGSWLAPDGLTNRLDLAEYLAERARSDHDPRRLAVELLGPSVPQETLQPIAFAESRKQGLALLLMSPDFQRR
jgi:uncharacterized protein (DUF1800 family)